VVMVVMHAVVAWFLTGLIWTVQIVHYPLFVGVSSERFVAYETAHSSRITALLAGPWALQGVTTAWLLLTRPPSLPLGLIVVSVVLAAVPVVVTLALSVPAHQVLGRGFDAGAHARLVSTNWLRTAAWTLHAVVATALLVAYR
jgi:hypothetical protein